MANETTIPMLPCPDIDATAEFYRMLGFQRTYRQTKPNPYIVVTREDMELHFFGLEDFAPEDSYGTCLVIVPDTGTLFDSFAGGMRAVHGKLLLSGIPRITRPRVRKNTGKHSGFSVVDTGGNWIRFFAQDEDAHEDDADTPTSRLAQALENAVVLGDSKGDGRHAARILDGALARHLDSAGPSDRVEALVYRAEIAVRMADTDRAQALLAQVSGIALSDAEQERSADALANAAELRKAVAGTGLAQ